MAEDGWRQSAPVHDEDLKTTSQGSDRITTHLSHATGAAVAGFLTHSSRCLPVPCFASDAASSSPTPRWIAQTLLPSAGFKQALLCRMQVGGAASVLLIGDSSIDVWRSAKAVAVSTAVDEEPPPPLVHDDHWDLRQEISAATVYRESAHDTLVTGSATHCSGHRTPSHDDSGRLRQCIAHPLRGCGRSVQVSPWSAILLGRLVSLCIHRSWCGALHRTPAVSVAPHCTALHCTAAALDSLEAADRTRVCCWVSSGRRLGVARPSLPHPPPARLLPHAMRHRCIARRPPRADPAHSHPERREVPVRRASRTRDHGRRRLRSSRCRRPLH